MSTSVGAVTSHFPDAENGFTTTLASTISSGAGTVPLNSVAGYTNGQPAVFVVDPSDATKKQTFTGLVDTAGVQLTSVVWTAGTNQTHSGGSTVVDYATATHIAMISKGIQVSLDQDGTLKAGAVDNAGVLASDVVTTAKILDSNVTTAKIADNNITFVKLLTTIFSGQVTSAANAGTAGGTNNYINLGGIRILWGIGVSKSVGTGGTNFTVTHPASFFTTIQYAGATPHIVGTSNHQWSTGITSSTATFTFAAGSDVNGSSQTTAWLVIGT